MPGPTTVAIFSLGVQPTGMKNAVSRPHAMIAAMLGMIMFDRKVPNFWMWTRTEVRCCRGAVAVTMLVLSEAADAARPRGPSSSCIFDCLHYLSSLAFVKGLKQTDPK